MVNGGTVIPNACLSSPEFLALPLSNGLSGSSKCCFCHHSTYPNFLVYPAVLSLMYVLPSCVRWQNEPSGSAISETDTDDDDIKSLSDCLEESASDPVEVTLPRQDWGLSLRANYCANRPAGSLRDSPCSESGDEEGGVVVRWKRMSDLAGDTSGYRLVWYCSTHNDRKEVLLHGDTNEYEIWSVSPR